MLTARREDGKMVTLALLQKEEIESLRLEKFACPECREDVLVKSGMKVIPHFAHRTKVTCSYQGGESVYHQKGKLLLYNWFRRQGIDVELEYYMEEIRQRPDIYLEIGKKKIAIEFQCVKLPLKEITKRNAGYEKLGITPIWILGAKLHKRVTSNLLRIYPFAQHMIQQYYEAGPMFLYYLCPGDETLSIVQHIYLLKGNIAYVQQKIAPLHDINLRHLFAEEPLKVEEYISVLLNEKKRFRLYRQVSYGKERKWENSLYERQLHRSTLPSYLHLPIKGQMMMRESLWQWQSTILFDLVGEIEKNQTFTEKEAEWLVRHQMIDANYFPLIKMDKHPVREYLEYLCKVGLIREVTRGVFVRQEDISFYSHLEEAIIGDNELLRRFMYNEKQIEQSL